jgi:hypothetical protein
LKSGFDRRKAWALHWILPAVTRTSATLTISAGQLPRVRWTKFEGSAKAQFKIVAGGVTSYVDINDKQQELGLAFGGDVVSVVYDGQGTQSRPLPACWKGFRNGPSIVCPGQDCGAATIVDRAGAAPDWRAIQLAALAGIDVNLRAAGRNGGGGAGAVGRDQCQPDA